MAEFNDDCARIAAEIDIGKQAIDELRRVKVINAELLVALQELFAACQPNISGSPGSLLERTRAAIANATEVPA